MKSAECRYGGVLHVCIHISCNLLLHLWPDGVLVRQGVGLATQKVAGLISGLTLSCNNLGQVVHTYVPQVKRGRTNTMRRHIAYLRRPASDG